MPDRTPSGWKIDLFNNATFHDQLLKPDPAPGQPRPQAFVSGHWERLISRSIG
jgi:hypothetical protein